MPLNLVGNRWYPILKPTISTKMKSLSNKKLCISGNSFAFKYKLLKLISQFIARTFSLIILSEFCKISNSEPWVSIDKKSGVVTPVRKEVLSK